MPPAADPLPLDIPRSAEFLKLAPRLEPPTSSLRSTLASHRERSGLCAAALNASESEARSVCSIFVEFDEVAEWSPAGDRLRLH
jgi:hypothetical protein